MIAAAERSFQKIATNLASVLNCPSSPLAISGAIVAEHIRATLFGALAAERAQTIHTTRVLSNARRAIELTWPRGTHARPIFAESIVEDEFWSDILHRMAELGDTWDSGKGQWLATPLRFVFLEGTAQGLLLGSLPLIAAAHSLGDVRITCAAAARFIAVNSVADRGLLQSTDDWLGRTTPLDHWTSEVLARAETKMEKVGGLVLDQLEVYAPDVLRSQRRPGRWISVGEIPRSLPEVRLCRPRLPYALHYNRPYYLAYFSFKDGGLALERQAPLAAELSLRLRFGLDARLGTPRQLLIAQSVETFAIDKPMMLPQPEERIMALGWRDRNLADNSSERLLFHIDAMPFVLHALKRLYVHPVITWRAVA